MVDASGAADESGPPVGTGFSTPAYLQRPAETSSRAERETDPRRPSGGIAVLPMAIGIAVLVGVMLLVGGVMAALGVFSSEVAEEPEGGAPPVAAAPAEADRPRRDPRMAVVPERLQTDVIRRVAFDLTFMNRSGGGDPVAAADTAMRRVEGYIPGSLEVDTENQRVIFEYKGPELLAQQYVDVLTLHSGIETGRQPTFLESRVETGP